MKQKPLTKGQIQKLHTETAANVKRFPALAQALADQLRVSAESVLAHDIGYWPLRHVWLFPERDEYAEVIGLTIRTMDGKKFMVAGSKRGLFYSVSGAVGETAEHIRWKRTDKDHPCLLCGKPDGCLYPEGEYENPAAVTCRVKSEGGIPTKFGYRFILDPERNAVRTTRISGLAVSNRPVLIVEGGSDTLAAYDLGFVGIGRPNDRACLELVAAMVSGRPACIIGENDAGAGVLGMEAVFAKIHTVCPECTKLLPPEGVKDLRKWLHAGLTPDELLAQIKSCGTNVLDPSVFTNDIAHGIADRWLTDSYRRNGKLLLHTYREQFVRFDGRCYQPITRERIHGEVYRFLEGKRFLGDKGEIKRYKPTRAKVGDILDACSAYCPIDIEPPNWITRKDGPDPSRLIAFQNGILNVDDYFAGRVSLANPDPDYFSFNVLPYDFDEDAESAIWDDLLHDIFNGDAERIRLQAQWYGYNCVPDISYERMMLYVGRPRSGKGTCLEALQAMLGTPHNCAVTSFTQLATQFPYENLVGKLSAAIAEAKAIRQRDADAVVEKLLTITGGDMVSINSKNVKASHPTRLLCRFTIAMNDLPHVTENSGAFEARTSILSYDNSYVGREDRGLKRRIRQEASSGKLINFALRGLKDLYSQKDFTLPRSSAIIMHKLHEAVAPISTFARQCLFADPEGAVSLTMLYSLWRWWCEREGIRYTAKNTFVRQLLASLPEAMDVRENEIGNQERVLAGVNVTEWAAKEMTEGR